MAKAAQILLLLLIAVAVQSYGGRRYFRGRSHGRFRNPNDYDHHRRHVEDERRAHEMKHYPDRHYQKSAHNPDDPPAVHTSRFRNPALAGFNPHHNEDFEFTSTTKLPPSIDSVPDNNASPGDDGNPDSNESVSNPGVDLKGPVNNDKPDDVSNVIQNGKSLDPEEPDHIDDNINRDEPSSRDNRDGTIHVNGMLPTGSNEQPDGSINGWSPGGDGGKTNPGDLDDNVNSNLDGSIDSNLDGNVDGIIGGNLPNIHLEKPTDSINVNGLEPGEDDGSSSIDSPNRDHDDGYLKNDGMLPDDKDKSGHDDKNTDNGELPPNGDNANINVNGLSPGNDNNEPDDGGDNINGNGLLPDGDDNNSGQGSINVNGLSPGGDDSKPDDNHININGLSPGGHDTDGHGNNGHGRLPSDDLGEGSIGAHVNNHGGLLPEPTPDPSEHIDHGGLEPDIKPDISGHIDIDHPQTYPTFPGDDILPNSGQMIPRPMPDVHGRPGVISSIKIPNNIDNNDVGTKNNSMMIPVLLPGGGHIMTHANALGNMPSYIIVMINGQPTLIQNPGGLGIGGENAGSLDLSKLILENNGLPIGGNNGGVVRPSWLNLLGLGGLGGLGGNGGAGIGGGGFGILPNMQPIWIGSQMPNFGGGGATGGPFIIPNNEPVEQVPVPIPIPRPMPPPGPFYPTPQPIPLPGPGFDINTYPRFPWPSIWNPNNRNVNVNFTHMPLTPNQESNIDWQSLLDLLANIDSRLPRPQPPQPTTPPQPREPLPTPQTNYPSYPYPYPYPAPYPYPPYPYLPNYPNTGFGKNVPNIDHDKDTANSRPELQPPPRPNVSIIPGPELQPRPRPDVPLIPGPERQPGPRPDIPIIPGPEPQPRPRPDFPIIPSREPQPGPRPDVPMIPGPVPQPGLGPDVPIIPGPEPQPRPRPDFPIIPGPVPQPGLGPDIPIIPGPEPQPRPRPDFPIIPGPEPQPGQHPDVSIIPGPEPQPGPRPDIPMIPGPVPQPGPRPNVPITPGPELQPGLMDPHKDVPLEPRPGGPLEPGPNSRPGLRPEHPGHNHHERPVIDLPNIHITLPKPTHIGKPNPGHHGLDSDFIDIVNVLLKFSDRNSHPPKDIGHLIKLLLAILKPGDKNPPLIPNLNEDIEGQPDLGNLGHLLLHLLDGRKEPNLNVLVEPGMDEGTQANLILLLQLLANNRGSNSSYPSMGYYQPENPLLYFLGHFPCDHPNIQALSGMQSNSNLWQLLASMYGHNYGRELRLDRSAEETDDQPAEAAEKTETN